MNNEQLKKELEKAAGTLNAENIEVTEKDKEMISKIIQKYQDYAGEEAIDSLLYNIQAGLKIMEEEKENERTK